MKISEIIERAINEHLWDGGIATNSDDEKRSMSCCAVAASELEDFEDPKDSDAVQWMLKRFGDSLYGTSVFDDMPNWKQRQRARALWLTLAAHIAREEGL